MLFYGGLVEIFYLFFYKAYLLVAFCDHVNGHAGQRGKKQRAGDAVHPQLENSVVAKGRQHGALQRKERHQRARQRKHFGGGVHRPGAFVVSDHVGPGAARL